MRMVELVVPPADAELAADRLWAAGARAVEEIADRAGHVRLRTALASTDALSAQRIGALPPTWRLGHVDVDDEPATTWREFANPVRVAADLVISPAWKLGRHDTGTTEVAVEPAGSFGLGDHPTTKLAATAAWRLVGAHDQVLDVGCGSGVLAIVAAKAGARRVVAVDVADAAIEATIDNARRNDVHIVEASTTPIGEVVGDYDVVLANILAPAIVAMSADLRRVTARGGVLVISGILATDHQHVLDALVPMEPVRTEILDGWAAVELRHRR